MNIKKKLINGSLAATLGLSLVAGGTWAAFNDIENVSASMAVGELHFDVEGLDDDRMLFNIDNLKPGDTMTREINMVNTGTLAIKDVLMSIESVEFSDYIPEDGAPGYSAGAGENENGVLDYLDQFRVSVILVGAEGGSGGFPKNIISPDANVTLKDFYLASDTLAGDGAKGATAGEIRAARSKVYNSVDRDYLEKYRLNVATINPNEWTGIPLVPHDPDRVQFTVEFIDNDAKNEETGLYEQNIYQGDSATITVSLEARQWGGLDVQDSDLNGDGYIETNKKANSEAGNPGRP